MSWGWGNCDLEVVVLCYYTPKNTVLRTTCDNLCVYVYIYIEFCICVFTFYVTIFVYHVSSELVQPVYEQK
jgi:hypothetical protein